MKPLNLDNSPCSPISSNCVLWQGPDITCINLCTGDTVSDVIHALATELCCVLNILDINSYDLSCFNANTSKPADFKAFIQFLTQKICELEGIPNHVHDTTTEGDCPTNCIVTVAEPFQTPESTTMNLVDYTTSIGTKVTTLISDINLNKAGIADHETRIVSLEVAPAPSFTLPSITPACVLPSVPTPIDQVLSALETDYCTYISNVGSLSDITTAISRQCAGLDTSPSKVNPGSGMAVEYAGTWISSTTTLGESINNLWITLCDLRDAQVVTLAKTDTDTIEITLSGGPAYAFSADVTDTGWVALEGFQYYPASITQPQVRRIGNVLHFRGKVIIPLSSDGGSTLVPLLALDSYNSEIYVQPFTGTGGGVVLTASGSLTFNEGLAVIPASVLTASTQIDGSYTTGYLVSARAVNLDLTHGTALTSVFDVGITTDKKLFISTLVDLELVPNRSAGYIGTSALRFATSNVRTGEFVPDYIAASTDIHNAPSNADFPLTSATHNITWPFSCDGGEEDQLGGFSFKLDGLIAYV